VEEPCVFVALDDGVKLPTLFPVRSMLEDQPFKSRPARHTQSKLLDRERSSFFKEIKQINDEGTIILEFGVEVVGVFPDLGGIAKSLEASSDIPSSVSDGRRIVPGRESGREEEGGFSAMSSRTENKPPGEFW
jgi:hypothetical protein